MTLSACNTLAGLDRDFVLASRDDDAAATERLSESDVHAAPSDGSAPPSPPFSDGGALDAEQPSAKKVIHCSTKTCSVEEETCCSARSGDYDCKSDMTCTCVPIGSCTGALRLACDDETDCPSGQICCGLLTNDGWALKQSACASPASCSFPGNVYLCDPTAERPGCADGGGCNRMENYPGIGRCSM
jgi:hypothetical protein